MSQRIGVRPTNLLVNGTLTNFGPGSVYYGDDASVTLSSYDGVIAQGGSVGLDGSQWLLSDSTAYVDVKPSPAATSGGATIVTTEPSSLAVGNVAYFRGDTGRIEGEYVGDADGNAAQVVDLTSNLVSYTGSLPDVSTVPDDTVYVHRTTGIATLFTGGSTITVGLAAQKRMLTLDVVGSGTNGDIEAGDKSLPAYPPANGSISDLYGSLGIGPDAGSAVIEVRKNGTSVHGANTKPTVPAVLTTGDPSVSPHVSADVGSAAVTTTDYLQAVVVSKGSAPTGQAALVVEDTPSISGTSSTVSVSTPTDWLDGDLLFAVFFTSPGTTTWTTPSGWSLINSSGTSNGNGNIWVFWRKLATGDTNWTFTNSGSSTNDALKRILLRGQKTTSPIDASDFNAKGSSTSGGTNAITALSINTFELIIERLGAARITAFTGGAASQGYVVLEGLDTGVSGVWAIAYKLHTTTGSKASPTITYDSGATAAIARILVAAGPIAGSYNTGRYARVGVIIQES